MANTWYPFFKSDLLTNSAGGNIMASGTLVKVILVDLADYTYAASHRFLTDVPSAARVGITAALANKSAVNGLFRADNINMPSAPGDQSEALIVFTDTGVEATSRLMLFFDTFTSGMPFTPGPVAGLQWNSSGIAQL